MLWWQSYNQCFYKTCLFWKSFPVNSKTTKKALLSFQRKIWELICLKPQRNQNIRTNKKKKIRLRLLLIYSLSVDDAFFNWEAMRKDWDKGKCLQLRLFSSLNYSGLHPLAFEIQTKGTSMIFIAQNKFCSWTLVCLWMEKWKEWRRRRKNGQTMWGKKLTPISRRK